MSYEGQDRRRNDELILSEIRALGSKIDTMDTTLTEHNVKMELLFGNGQPGVLAKFNDRLSGLEVGAASERGFKRALSAAIGLGGAAVGWAISYFGKH